jgi:cell division FtsZ-interacting protein ZapD
MKTGAYAHNLGGSVMASTPRAGQSLREDAFGARIRLLFEMELPFSLTAGGDL